MASQLLILAQVLPSRGPLVAETLVLLMQEKGQREGPPTIVNMGKNTISGGCLYHRHRNW